MADSDLKPATIAAHAAGAAAAAGGVVPPVRLSTTYLRGEDYGLLAEENSYGRDDSQTVREAEETLRQLEGAAQSLLFPSGMAAVAALFRGLAQESRVVLQSGIYYGVTAWVSGFCARRGIRLDFVDAADADALGQALGEPADIVWVETPSNPWLRIVDIAAAAELAHSAGALLAVDGTAATPLLTRALELGADISMHSATKAINGHSDVLAGVLSCRDPDGALWRAIAGDRREAGAIIGPFEAWLCLRGMRTLPLRVERMCASALRISQWLQEHGDVEEVWYPGLPDHPGHETAVRQMRGGFGYLASVLVRGGAAEALDVAGRLRLLRRATSLGGVESLVEHRATIEPQSGIPQNLLRVSVGIEDDGDLIADLDQALAGSR